MPVVPRLTQPVRDQALPNARFNANAPIEAFGGGQAVANLNQAAQGLTNTVLDVASREKQKADDTMSQKAYSEFVTRKNSHAWGENGAFSRRGEKAIGVMDEVMPLLDKDAEDIEKNMLTNDAQRAFFRRMVEQEKREFNGQLQKHIFVESERFADETMESTVNVMRDDAIQNFHEPGKIEKAIALQKGAILSRSEGKPKEWIEQKTREAVSKTHAGVISRMLANGQDLAAKDYYDANRDSLGEYVSAIEKNLKEGSTRGESQRQADAIWATSKGSLKEALAAAREIKDPDIRDLTETRLKQRSQDEKAALAQAQDDLYLEATNLIDNSPRGSRVRDLIPPEKWNTLSLAHRQALENRANDSENNDKRWLDFLALPAKEVAGLSRSDFETKYWVHFDRSTRTKAESQWNAAREAIANPKKEAEFKSLFGDKDMVLDALKSANVAGIKYEDTVENLKQDSRKASAYTELIRKADDAFKLYFHETGKNPSDEEKKKILNGLLLNQVYLREWGRDPKKPVSTLTAEDKKAAYVPISEIPAKKRQTLLNFARANGAIDPKLPDERAQVLLQNRIENAYAAALAGASDDEFTAIMMKD